MVVLREFLDKLQCSAEQLAGQSGMEDVAKHVAHDVVLLNHQEQIWLTGQKTDEFEGALVFVQSRMFPGYLSTFDLLLRFLKQAGAVGVLFQGGKRSDFSRATMMLADNVGLPLIWIPEPITYSVVARQFYALLLEAQQRTKVLLTRARNRLENDFPDVFTLYAWMDHVEHELMCDAMLRIAESDTERPMWQLVKAKLALVLPMRVLDRHYELCLTPVAGCLLYERDAHQLWIAELAGVLAAQAAYFLLSEIPGLAAQNQWATSFESMLYFVMSRLPMFKSHEADPASSSTSSSSVSLASISLATSSASLEGDGTVLPDWVGSLSLRRRAGLISMSTAGPVSVLWITIASQPARTAKGSPPELNTLKTTFSGSRPFAYRFFRTETMTMREQALDLLRDARFTTGMQRNLLVCVPWRDWQMREGIAVVWIPFSYSTAQPAESTIRDLTSQLTTRLQSPLRAFYHREEVGKVVANPEELLPIICRGLERSYPDFLSAVEQSQTVQFAQQGKDVANLIMQGRDPHTSYHHALDMLQPVLGDKQALVLLEALEAFLECGGKMQCASERLYLHRNTLRYRLKRTGDLLGINLHDAETRFIYHIAIRAWRLKNPEDFS